MKTRRFLLVLLPILWLALALRVWRLDAQSLWYDEGYSYYLGAYLPAGEALDLTVRDIVPPLYYLLLRLWLSLAGTSEYALRFLSVLSGVMAVAVMAQIGRLLTRRVSDEQVGIRAGLLSSGLVAIAPVFIWLSRDARMYGPLVTWSLLATWGMLRALSGTASRRARYQGWALFVGAGLAALYTHTVSAFWLLGQVAFLLLIAWYKRGRRSRNREVLVALGLTSLGYLPWVIVAFFSYRRNVGFWPGYLPPTHLWRIAWETFVGGEQLTAALTRLSAAWFGAALLLSWLLLLWKRSRVVLYLFCYLILPLLAMGLAFQHVPKLAPRYPTAIAPALFLSIAVGGTVAFYRSLGGRFLFVLGMGGVVALSVYADANLFFDPVYAKDDWRSAAEYVQAHREPDEKVILVSGHLFPVFAYYYGWEGWHSLPEDVLLDVNHVLSYPDVAPRLNQMLADAEGAWLVLWQDEVVDPTGLVPALLGDVGRELASLTFSGSSAGDRVTLRHFQLQSEFHFPDELPVAQTLDRVVAPGLSLLGYSLPAGYASQAPDGSVPADADLTARFFWRADTAIEGAYGASLRLFDRLDQEWARQDSLLAGPYFTERWAPRKPVMGQYTVTLPLGTPPGHYTPTLLVYREDEIFETLSLSTVVITRPVNAPALYEFGPALVPGSLELGTRDLSNELSLVGAGFDQQTITPCQDWSLSLVWRAEAEPTRSYRLHLSVGSSQTETPLAADYPTALWQPGDVWRTRHRLPINCRARDGTYSVQARLLNGAGHPVSDPVDLAPLTIVAGRQYTLPTGLTAALDVRLFEPSADASRESELIRLMGYRLNEERVKRGEKLQITLYWRAGRETDRNYSVFAHLEGERVWSQHDSWPMEGLKPTSTWAREEVVADRHVIPLGQDIPPGTYRLVVGMYDSATFEPLTALNSGGQVIPEGRVVLQTIELYVP